MVLDKKFDQYVDDNLSRFAQDIMKLVSQPSVSARKEGLNECADLVEGMLKEVGATTRQLKIEGAAPLVYGEMKSSRSKKTVLFYNHYDVQPEEPLELWKSPPFKPEIRDGRIWGRGVSDDKGELVSRLKLIETYVKVYGEPPCNVKFCFEGEEESGSVHLAEYVAKNQDLFKADGTFWEYGDTDDAGTPSIALGMKGMIYLELVLKSLSADAHSSFAAVLPSAAWRMVRLLNMVKGPDERIQVPGWYDQVESVSPEEEAVITREEFDADAFLKTHGAKGFVGGLTVEQAKKALPLRPTANIAGIWAGYQGPGGKTVLPKEIHVKMDLRLVPRQDPKDVLAKLRKFMDEKGYGDVEIRTESLEPGARTSFKDPLPQAAMKAGQAVWGKKPKVEISSAGTGPFYLFVGPGKGAAISIGVSSTDAGMHAPNENLRLDYLATGIKWFGETLENYLA